MPRYMIIRMGDADTEQGLIPDDPTLFQKMGDYMESMQKAGILRGGDGLKPTREGARVKFAKENPRKPTVIDGPFTESKELVAGYTLIEVGSKEEAIEWMKRWPAEDVARQGLTLELRRLYEAEDFGDAFSPEDREREEKLRADLEKKS